MALLPLVSSGVHGAKSLTHTYSSLYSVLWMRSAGQAALECLAQGLTTLPLHSLRLEPLASDGEVTKAFAGALAAAGFECHPYPRFQNWFHRLDGDDFRAYWSKRPSRLRNTVERKQRKLMRECGYRVHVYTQESASHALSQYHDVHRASWKPSEVFPSMVDGMVTRFAEAGWLRLGVLTVSYRPVAAQIWFVVHRKASIFKLVYDTASKASSPGSILTRHLMEHVIDIDHVDEIDFLYGSDAYKSDWVSQKRDRVGLAVGRPPRHAGKPGWAWRINRMWRSAGTPQ